MAAPPTRIPQSPAHTQRMHQARCTSRPGGAGIVLLAVLIAVAIGLYIMFGMNNGGVTKQAVQTKQKAKATVSAIHVQQIVQLVTSYKLSEGAMPTSIDDIPEAKALKDTWGNTYQLAFPDSRTITVTSPGPDGELDTDDDITQEGKVQV